MKKKGHFFKFLEGYDTAEKTKGIISVDISPHVEIL